MAVEYDVVSAVISKGTGTHEDGAIADGVEIVFERGQKLICFSNTVAGCIHNCIEPVSIDQFVNRAELLKKHCKLLLC